MGETRKKEGEERGEEDEGVGVRDCPVFFLLLLCFLEWPNLLLMSLWSGVGGADRENNGAASLSFPYSPMTFMVPRRRSEWSGRKPEQSEVRSASAESGGADMNCCGPLLFDYKPQFPSPFAL